MNRRSFLKGLGTAGAGYGVWGLLGQALAETGEAPKRLLLISHCHGWPYESWKMNPGGKGESAAWQLGLSGLAESEFSHQLAPLFQHRSRLIALDGLSLATAELDMDGNRHDTGWIHAWTGNWADFSASDSRSTSASLDQLVAAQIARADRLPSLELSVDAGLENGRPVAYAANGSRLPVSNTPELAWQRLFGLAAGTDPLTLRQREVLDFAHEEYKALCPKLSGAQRERLDAHYALLHQLGDRIEGLAGLTCELPEVPGTPANYDENFDAFAELIGAAFACDVTRVASLSLGEMPTADFGGDHISDDVHKGIAHYIYDDPERYEAMGNYTAKHAEQVARLVSLLESLPDLDGRSVMDNTLILWSSELANGWHGYQHLCPVILGGSWAFETGRYLRWPHETPISLLSPTSLDPSGYAQVAGIPHQRMLVSVAQAMGLQIDSVGIDHVQGQSGDWVDCTGPLTGL